ncbi:hypothetical protein LWI28_017292 [Acer negundo]|uniref:Protein DETOXIFICATION n=1 Tax=Acer negundo TaxID=4023 RepID=A0AAD5JUZ5_ACENE|nr:hypothetical protein LWI28_017292 [Acer negundo]
MESINGDHENVNQPLLRGVDDDQENKGLASRAWIESKKLWYILGPSIFNSVASFSMNVITQAIAGHLGDVELAATTISITVISGFNYGLLLGMASALETLCGQAYGAKKYHMLGIYLQRSWIVLFLCCFLLLPFYIFATPILKFIGQTDEVAEMSGVLSIWLIPLHFCFAFHLPMNRFLQSQLKAQGCLVALDISWWVLFLGNYGYTVCGGCPWTWTGFSVEAFSELWGFLKLSASSGVMLCLENWYYRILLLMTGYLENVTLVIDALSVCMNINGWEMTIPLAFLAATGVRVANELGAGNGKAAKFATKVSVLQSTMIGICFCLLILVAIDKIALVFTDNADVLKEVDKLTYLLAISVLLNSVQPVLSGVSIGSGWQATIAYINLGCYYLIGLPLGFLMGSVFKLGVMGLWGGMIFGGTGVQTVILSIITIRCDWEKQVENASNRVSKWSSYDPRQQSEDQYIDSN